MISLRPEIADARLNTNEGDWVRLEFTYDYMGRRIAKKYLRGEGETVWSLEKAAENVLWGADRLEKFVYDGWMPVAAYKSAIEDDLFLGFTGSWAWGPDLSGTLGGAGGIGGLAIVTNDEWDAEHPSSGMGPMVPLYDGNGNIKRLVPAWDVNVVAAKYEYGPFGETRSIDGPLGQRNPFRWSTKYTDAETGLVYYGYRYYSAGLGRWLSRDPASEASHSNIYAGLNNQPTSQIDADGRIAFLLDFNMISVTIPTPVRVPFFPGTGINVTAFADVSVLYNCGTRERYYGVSIGLAGGVQIGALPSWGVSFATTSFGVVHGVESADEWSEFGWQVGVTGPIFSGPGSFNAAAIGGDWIPFDPSAYAGLQIGSGLAWSANPGAAYSITAYMGISYNFVGKVDAIPNSAVAQLLCGYGCDGQPADQALENSVSWEALFDESTWRDAQRARVLEFELPSLRSFATSWFGGQLERFQRDPVGVMVRQFLGW